MSIYRMMVFVMGLPCALGACRQDETHAMQGPNRLPRDRPDQVWRFAVFPDTQGRDDDNMPKISHDIDGNDVGVEVYHGYDYNNDGIYDGDSYRLNVDDPYNPYIEIDSNGNPITVAVEEREDFPYDFKIIPQPLVEAVTDKIIELDVDLVLATGDITEYRAESDYVMWMDKVARTLNEADIDIYPVRGNHEIVNGRNWLQWFSAQEEPNERQSVDNVLNGFSAYEPGDSYDQGYKLYKAYPGSLIADKLSSGHIMGFPRAEDLNYYFIHKNSLFIGIDFYFGELYSSAYKGTWIELFEWLREVITTHGPTVDHVIVYGHEPLSTKKRPQAHDGDSYTKYLQHKKALENAVAVAQSVLEQAQSSLDDAVANGAPQEQIDQLKDILEAAKFDLDQANDAIADVEEPGLAGYDMGQLGYLLLQDQSQPGLAEEILSLFTEYQVNYFAGHDHQYARSLIHPHATTRGTATGFFQIIAGNASWKAYEDLYGFHSEYETGLFIDNFYNEAPVTGDGYNVHSGLGKGVSFVVVEINGRQITTANYFASHNYTESDLNLGLTYDYSKNCWQTYSGSYRSGTPSASECVTVNWIKIDESTRTMDGIHRVVGPYENYWATTKAPIEDEYIGSEATIMDGYNLTFNSSYAAAIDRIETMSEMLALSWFVDEDESTLSDVLWISGTQNQEGSHCNQYGDHVVGASPSLTYINRSGYEVNNPTHVSRDGILNKGIDAAASLTGDNTIAEGDGGKDQANWANRYKDDGLDFADALAISFAVPKGHQLDDVTIGRYDEKSGTWRPILREECYTEAYYSEHFSVHYRISEQEPEGGFAIEGCQQFYWGYDRNSHAVWGHIHVDGQFAIIARPGALVAVPLASKVKKSRVSVDR